MNARTSEPATRSGPPHQGETPTPRHRKRLGTVHVTLVAIALLTISLAQDVDPPATFAFTGSAIATLEDRPGAWTRIQTVTLTAPTDGWIHLQATGYLTIYDPQGEGARYWFLIGDDAWTDPRHGREGMNVASYEPEPPATSATSRHPLATQRAIPVTAGTHTFYAIGYHETGERATATYEQVTLTATFHGNEIDRLGDLEDRVRELESLVAELGTMPRPTIASADRRSIELTVERQEVLRVTIEVPGPGTIEVRGEAVIAVGHDRGERGSWGGIFVFDQRAASCDRYYMTARDFLVDEDLPTGLYRAHVQTTTIDVVPSGGAYTYCMSARKGNVAVDVFAHHLQLVATYFPAPQVQAVP